MFSTPLTCCSIGSATVSTIVRAEAPGYRVVTCTVGGVTSGHCATGSENSATPPITSIRIARTLARTGRSMKYLEIIECGHHPCKSDGGSSASLVGAVADGRPAHPGTLKSEPQRG